MTSSEPEQRRKDFRRWTFTIAAAIAAAALAHAQSYPARVVKIVSPFVPGGPGDLLPRAVAAGLSPLLGQPVIVENRPGAATIIAMQAVAKSPPDGYTLIFTSVSSFINLSAYKSLPYDPVGDFAPIALCFTTPLYLVVHPSLPANSVAELIALAKSRPSKLTFASGGTGTTAHLAGELFKSLAGVDMRHVPYKSAGPAMMDVMAAHVDLMFGSAGLSEARAGKVRVLAVTSARRSAAAPELPTVQESGLPGFDATLWFGILAPAKTPAAIVARLSGDIGRVLAQAELRERFNTVDVTPSTPEEFAELIRREIPRWRKVFEAAKIQPE
ncbi:MAG: tripartite tricarboxylate transporter substrate binding protein [Candidatus Eisenbacteria bacterium]|uniref:Tripartite tricarboxylate transporter substrate binding protein n=1 Tax=Eiseniibacteriota bacterium TaxID=2212470 RepID=A0A538S8E9_UNCEI|nr:MAG: tripartite tricarboxylate transporter substrate binding protein [Candidatus Eisenbacteria bacterium]